MHSPISSSRATKFALFPAFFAASLAGRLPGAILDFEAALVPPEPEAPGPSGLGRFTLRRILSPRGLGAGSGVLGGGTAADACADAVADGGAGAEARGCGIAEAGREVDVRRAVVEVCRGTGTGACAGLLPRSSSRSSSSWYSSSRSISSSSPDASSSSSRSISASIS